MRKALLALVGTVLVATVMFGPAAAGSSCYIENSVPICIDGGGSVQAPDRLAMADRVAAQALAQDLAVSEPAVEAPAEEGSFDIYKVVVALCALLASGLSTILGLVLKGFLAKLRIDIDLGNGAILDAAIKRGIDWAIVTADRLDGVADGKITIRARSSIVAAVGQYLVGKIPDVLKHFGLDPDSPRLKEMIEARLKPYLAA